jgi:UDP-N-acetylbacillosamine transaminase
MPEITYSRVNRWLTTLTLGQTDPYKLMKMLDDNKIESRPLWKPMHMQPLFHNALAVVDGTSENLFKTGLCLPSGSSMSDSELNRVCEVIKKALL